MSDDTSAVSALRATAHPVRLRILSLLTASAMSAADIARELDLTHANASYHLRVLADAGAVVEAGEEKIRGGVAKRYRHPWEEYDTRGGERGAATRAEDGEVYVRAVAEELVRRFRERAPQTPSMTTDAEMWVTPEVWDEVRSLVERASTLLHAEARPPRTDGTLHVNLTAAAFQLSADPSPIAPESRRVGPEVTGR
jgi:DNA-binding transcriptional ArsR family regulator